MNKEEIIKELEYLHKEVFFENYINLDKLNTQHTFGKCKKILEETINLINKQQKTIECLEIIHNTYIEDIKEQLKAIKTIIEDILN